MWWLLWILPLIILIAIIYLLIAPFYIELDSKMGICRFRFHKLANAEILMHDDSLFLRFKIAWWRKELDLFAPKQINKQIADKDKPVKKKSAFKMKRLPQRMLSIIKSFSVRKCYVSIDTGNYPANGILYPWFYLLGAQTGKTIMINFWGENEIILTIKNSLARIAWAFLRAK